MKEALELVKAQASVRVMGEDEIMAMVQKLSRDLRSIDEGEYGYCQDTGEPIGLKRLLARPTATLSVEAQERREQLKKQFAD